MKSTSKSCDKQTRKRGRPPTGFDKTAYQREYMRKRRAEEALEAYRWQCGYPEDEKIKIEKEKQNGK